MLRSRNTKMESPSMAAGTHGSQRSSVTEVPEELQKPTSQTDGLSKDLATEGEKDGDLLENNDQKKGISETKPEKDQSDSATELPTDRHYSVTTVLKMSFRRVAWRLYLALLLSRLIPTIYRTTRVYYLGDLPDDYGVNIASQLTWVNVLLEVIQEALILPLFYMIGVSIEDAKETENRVKTGVLFTFLVHTLFAVVIVSAAAPLVEFMAQDPDLLDETVMYIRLEMAAVPFNGVVQFATVVFTLYQWRLHLYMLLVMRLVLSILLDTFFLSSFNFSLQLGVNGIAYGNIITNTIICFYCFAVLLLKYPKSCLFSKMSLTWMKTWGVVGFYSGLDSLVRNVFYILCIVRMMNVIEEQGTYWRANEFIWNWLLLAFLPLADVLKQDTGASTVPVMNHKLKTTSYAVVTVLIAVVWCASIPGWKPFFETVMNIPEGDVDVVFDLVLILMPSYIIFMINTLMDSVFIGKGKTIMLAIQAIITNVLVYGVSFVLYLTDVYVPSLINISILFASGIIVDSILTIILYIWYLKKVNYKI